MKREVFDDLWDKADKEHSSQGNNSFTFKHHLFAVLDDELKEQQQPQLTIPKSIADEVEDNGLDSYVIYSSLPSDSYLIPEWEPLVDLSDKFIKWCETTEKWWAILDAYLAGKALGVDLVKVVSDE